MSSTSTEPSASESPVAEPVKDTPELGLGCSLIPRKSAERYLKQLHEINNMPNKRVLRTIEYFGPADQVDFLLSMAIGERGFTVGNVRISEMLATEVPANGAAVDYIRDSRYAERTNGEPVNGNPAHGDQPPQGSELVDGG